MLRLEPWSPEGNAASDRGGRAGRGHPLTTESKKPISGGAPRGRSRSSGQVVARRALEGLEPADTTGPRGLLTQLAGRVIEPALGAELTGHLRYPAG
jgi:hypothetical protein